MEDISKAAGDGDDDLESLEKIEAENPGAARESERPSTMEDVLKAAGDGDLELLQKIEANNPGAVAAARDSERRTALHLAAGEGHTEVCKYLIAKLGVPVDPRDVHGETPLYESTMQCHVGTVKYLLTNKANHNVKSRLGVTTLHHAATKGNMELVTILIAAGGMKLDSRSYMGTPLACAVNSGSYDCFKTLIQAGAAPEIIMNPLHAAAESGSVEIVNWFLKDGHDPNACNNIGWKPIKVAAYFNNLDVVELLFPRTRPFLDVLDWSVQGIMDHASTQEAALQISQFVQMGSDVLSDKEIDQRLAEMLLTDENVFFEGWSPKKKRLFYESVLVQPTTLKQILDHGLAEIKNSVICDLTNKNRVQSSYLRALHHYQAWHFSGSDLMYEIGPHRKRFCASRKDQTFVFWFRYLQQDVGLVIDGQTAWVEGMLRRTRGKDGRYKYAAPIQFARNDSSSSKQKAPMTDNDRTPYIVHSELLEADYGGNYAGPVSSMKFSLDTTRTAVIAISDHDEKKSFHQDCHAACDNLVFLATEAGKNRWIFEYTMHSLDPRLKHPIVVPSDFDGTVTSHQQVSEKVLSALKATTLKKLKNVPGGGYQIVRGTVFRTLWQCLNAYIILRRETVFKTKFFLKGKEREFRKQVKFKPQRERRESNKEFEEKVRQENVRTGTLFDPKLHGGLRHKFSDGPQPLKPSWKRWYHVDEPGYVYKD